MYRVGLFYRKMTIKVVYYVGIDMIPLCVPAVDPLCSKCVAMSVAVTKVVIRLSEILEMFAMHREV